MDARKLTELLRATIDPAQQKEAEGQLTQVSEIGYPRARENVLARFCPAVGQRRAEGGRERRVELPSILENMWHRSVSYPRHPVSRTCGTRGRVLAEDNASVLPTVPAAKRGGSPLFDGRRFPAMPERLRRARPDKSLIRETRERKRHLSSDSRGQALVRSPRVTRETALAPP